MFYTVKKSTPQGGESGSGPHSIPTFLCLLFKNQSVKKNRLRELCIGRIQHSFLASLGENVTTKF